MKVRIKVELDASTVDGWKAYKAIKNACAISGVECGVFAEVAEDIPPPPRMENDPPAGYPAEWESCEVFIKAFCQKFHDGKVEGGWSAKFRRGVANATKPPKSLRPILKRQGLLQPDGYAYVWWRISKEFSLLPPPETVNAPR